MRYNKQTLADMNFQNKTAIVRLDLNVPIKEGKITNDKRIVAALDTLKYLINQDAKIVVLSHLSRIKTLDDIKNCQKTLMPVARRLQELLPNNKVTFCEENTGSKVEKLVKSLNKGEILVLENTRYNDIDSKGNVVKLESKNDAKLGKFWASLGDVYVNDAFGTAHRAHASNVGIASNIKDSCVGKLIENELTMLGQACDNPKKPLVAILGGSKVSDKIKTIDEIAKIADHILIGGAMAFSFQKAMGYEVGKSKIDDESVESAKKLLEKYSSKIVLPVDALYASEISENAKTKKVKVGSDNFDHSYMGLDLGKKTIKLFKKILKNANTVIWNGPLGMFELEKFAYCTRAISKILSKLTSKNVFTLIGGGDSAAAAIKFGYEDGFTHISTGGGASLAYLENSSLPGIECIPNKKDLNSKGEDKPQKHEENKKPVVKKESKKPSAKKEKKPTTKKTPVVKTKKLEPKDFNIIAETPKKKSSKKKPAKKVSNKGLDIVFETPKAKSTNFDIVIDNKKNKAKKSKPIPKKPDPKKQEQSKPKKKTNANSNQEIITVSSLELNPYDFKKRRGLWKVNANYKKDKFKCSVCHEMKFRSIHTDKKKNICYFCLIKRTTK